MNHRVLTNLAALLLAFVLGIGTCFVLLRNTNPAGGNAFNEQAISELRQQANVLTSLLRGDSNKASEFVITRIQSDLTYFDTIVGQKDMAVNKQKLCDLLTTRVAATVESYSQKEPAQSQIAEEHLRNLLKWCDSQSTTK